MLNQNFHFPEEDMDEPKTDELFNRSDDWIDQLGYISDLMELEIMLADMPKNWHLIAVEPDPEELAVMDANAEEFLASLRG